MFGHSSEALGGPGLSRRGSDRMYDSVGREGAATGFANSAAARDFRPRDSEMKCGSKVLGRMHGAIDTKDLLRRGIGQLYRKEPL